MPTPHKNVTTCLRTKGPLSMHCTCEHCNLAVCSVCGAWEGGLPTHCPGARVTHDQMDAIAKGEIDFVEGEWTTNADISSRPLFEVA